MSSSTAHPQPLQPIDSPLTLRHIPYHFDNEDADKSALDLVEALNEDWKTAEGPVVFVRFTDGITNTLTKAVKKKPGLTESEVDDEAILIRAYGKGTDVLIDRERELRAHNLLATLNLAPPLLARFDNGKHLSTHADPGLRHMLTWARAEIPEVYKAVAKRLGQWHGSLPISAITNTPDLVDTPVDDHCAPKDGKQTRPSPNLWTVMQQWIDALPKETEDQRNRIDALQVECTWLSKKLGNTPGLVEGKDYVFGHCDLLSGNVIVEKPSGSGTKFDGQERPVSFIDYEYATPVPAAFDIANHFAEWAGFDCDHSAVPTRSQRIDFLKAYVGSFRFHSINDFDNVVLEIDPHNDVTQLNQQVDLFRGVPGLYWGIWALIQAMISQIDFDYASYAEVRLGEYWSWKAEVDGSRAKEGKEMPLRERRWAEE